MSDPHEISVDDLISDFEAVRGALYKLFDRQHWTIAHMGVLYHESRIILTDAEFEELKALSEQINYDTTRLVVKGVQP
jgi:hypothetical protein